MKQTLTLNLEPAGIALGNDGLLEHQEETVAALQRFPIVLNCALTGAGKTKAAHLGVQSTAFNESVLFIAPTNALVAQHFADAKMFVKENKLPHKVVAVDGSVLGYLMRKKPAFYRPATVLHEIIYNPRTFSEELGLDDTDAPLWLITNPDQVWASIVRGRERDTRNLLKQFINHFRFVAVDEFHYYSAEQLTLFFLCMAFWKHFGQFDDGLKMLLLTATPDQTVKLFLQRMALEFAQVGLSKNDNSPLLPVLAPVNLTLATGSVSDYTDTVVNYCKQNLDGVIISDSLFEINKAYQTYIKAGVSAGRITGPIRSGRRQEESEKRLILATPTVDLGFNFIKPHPKNRQEIDFIVASAYTKSAFWQRLGRAGRVLGRKETETPSQAAMLLPDAACFRKLVPYQSQSISRALLGELLNLRDKRLKGNALAREGLYMATRQLIEIERMLPEIKKDIVEQIFKTLKACFDPNNLTGDWPLFRKRHWLAKQFDDVKSKYPSFNVYNVSQHLRTSDHDEKDDKTSPLQVLFGSWVKNYFYQQDKLEIYNQYIKESSRMSLVLPLIKKRPSLKREIVNYYKEQRLRQAYLFDFRGGSYNKDVVIYDPQGIYSAHIINRIDIVTLLAKYQFQGPLARSDAEKQWRLSLPRGKQFFELTDFQDYPFRPVFHYSGALPVAFSGHDSNQEQEAELLPRYWQTVALHNLTLEFENRKTGFRQIPPDLKKELTGISELFFITPIENRFILSRWLKEYAVRTGELQVDKPYSVIFGKDAIFISEELYFKYRNESC